MQAAALLLERDGIEALTTNAAARVAGVSVGSVYRYFPDKQAIVAELARGLERRGLELATRNVEALRDAESRRAVWELVGVLLDPSLGGARLRRTLLLEVPRAWIRDATRATDTKVEELLAAFVASRPDDFRPVDPRVVSFIAFHAVEGVIEGALLTDPALLSEPWLREELFHLTWRYAAADGRLCSPPACVPAHAVSARPAEPVTAEPVTASLLSRLARERSHRVDTSPRPAPATRRGRATAERILDAAAGMLQREPPALGVRALAAEAGVAPAALYRHFRNTQAVVAELARRYELRSRNAFAERLAHGLSPDLHEAIVSLAHAFAPEDVAAPSLRHVLLNEVPRGWIESVSAENERAAMAGVAWQIRCRRDAIRAGDPERMAFVVCWAFTGVAEAALLARPAWVRDGTLLRESVALAHRYLRA